MRGGVSLLGSLPRSGARIRADSTRPASRAGGSLELAGSVAVRSVAVSVWVRRVLELRARLLGRRTSPACGLAVGGVYRTRADEHGGCAVHPRELREVRIGHAPFARRTAAGTATILWR